MFNKNCMHWVFQFGNLGGKLDRLILACLILDFECIFQIYKIKEKRRKGESKLITNSHSKSITDCEGKLALRPGSCFILSPMKKQIS